MSESPSVSKIQEEVAGLLRERRDIAAVYLLGSALAGRLRPDSDIDVALLPMGEPSLSLPFRDRLSFAAELERRLGRRVDVGIITPANLIYAAEAILKGQRIVTIDPEYVATTETRLLGCYLQLREDRREVEKAYRAS